MDESRDLQNGGESESTETKIVGESEPKPAEQSDKQPSEDDKTEMLENGEGAIKPEEKETNGEQKETKELQNGIDKNDEDNKEKEEASDDSPSLPRRTRSRMADGEFGLGEHAGVTSEYLIMIQFQEPDSASHTRQSAFAK